jgi:phosphopantetheine--protein transferase-like protein
MNCIGVDIVSLDKVKELWKHHSTRLLDDVYTLKELSELNLVSVSRETIEFQVGPWQLQQLAIKFAAKEAVAKALALPHRVNFKWCEIEIIGIGQMEVSLSGRLSRNDVDLDAMRFKCTGSSTKSHALAMVIGESK